MNLIRQILREFGFGEHEPPRTLLDIILGAAGGLACLFVISFVFDKKPSPELRHHALISAGVLLAAILLAKNRLAVTLGVIAVVGLRGLIAALLYVTGGRLP